MGLQAMKDMDKLIETFRSAAHTAQRGKPRDQAIHEFKQVALELYTSNGEHLPVPAESASSEGSISTVQESEGLVAGIEADSAPSEYFTPSDKSSQLGRIEGEDKSGLSSVYEISTLDGTTGKCVGDVLYSDKHSAGQSAITTSLPQTIEPQQSTVKVPKNLSFFSKEWWTPTRGVALATWAGIGLSLIAGGVILFNKLLRKLKKPENSRRRRVHPRSWNIADSDTAQMHALF